MSVKWNPSSPGCARWRQINSCFRRGLFLVFFFVLTGCGGIPGGGQGFEFVSESGPTLYGESGPATLDGIIYKPKGRGPFPALVLLHGCGGLGENVFDWAGKLIREGYVAMVVDSFSARGITDACGVRGLNLKSGREFDAYGAHDFLKKQPFVDGKRIGVMGWSQGGGAALWVSHDIKKRFQAAVAFYPPCGAESFWVTTPLLMLLGKLDDWTPAENCLEWAAKPARKKGYPVEWKVYPNAYHSFDNVELGWDVRINRLGFAVAHDEEATIDSWKRIRVFLNKHLRGGK